MKSIFTFIQGFEAKPCQKVKPPFTEGQYSVDEKKDLQR